MAYFDERPEIAHGIGNLEGYRPRAALLGFGERWRYRCAILADNATCASDRSGGRAAFRCVSRRTGLTCRNSRGHGFWIGRYRGYDLF
jgi:hypothetical protein